jgi:hypothetical protein
MRGQKAAVAPFYDMLCVEAYLPRQTMSMAIAGENKPGWVEGPHWDAMAFEAGVAPRLVRGVLSRMNSDLPDAISKIIGDERLLPGYLLRWIPHAGFHKMGTIQEWPWLLLLFVISILECCRRPVAAGGLKRMRTCSQAWLV